MPIDYTHPNRINYEHPRRKQRTVAESPALSSPPPTSPGAPKPPNASRGTAPTVRADPVTCVCGMDVDRAIMAQCTSCGSDLWSLGGDSGLPAVPNSAPTAHRRRPVGAHLPEAMPAKLDTGFISAMQSYSDHLRSQMNEALELEGPVVDSKWKEIAARILTLHFWDPAALNLEVLRVNLMKSKIQEWAARGGMADLNDIGWTPILDFVERIDTVASPGDRDWATGDIEIQHPKAIPVQFDYLESVRRIAEMTSDVSTSGQDIYIKLANVFNAHVEDFARQNNAELEVLTGDITKSITSRRGWEGEWAFMWPTYFGELGVYAYNDWVDKSHQIEWHIAKNIIHEAEG